MFPPYSYPFPCIQRHLDTSDSQIYMSPRQLLWALEHVARCPLTISTWVSQRHQKSSKFWAEVINSSPHPPNMFVPWCSCLSESHIIEFLSFFYLHHPSPDYYHLLSGPQQWPGFFQVGSVGPQRRHLLGAQQMSHWTTGYSSGQGTFDSLGPEIGQWEEEVPY